MTADAGALRDEIELLERSLADAHDEHARGELDAVELAAIERRDGARLDEARARLAVLDVPDTEPIREQTDPTSAGLATRGKVRRSRRLLALAIGCGVLVVAVVVLAATNPFAGAGPAVTILPSTRITALLGVAEAAVGEGQPLRALTAYDAVLRLAPTNPEALVEAGWLRYEWPGLGDHNPTQVALGFEELRRAARLAPRDAASHLYFGIALYQHEHDCSAGRAEVRRAQQLPESSAEWHLGRSLLRLFGGC